MDVFNDPAELTAFIWRIKRNFSLKLWDDGRAKPAYTEVVGFVPTMGAFHDGHLSLVERSVEDNHFTVVSIFVNPLQFSQNEDLDEYPKSFEADCKSLEEIGVDAVFYPDVRTFYPDDFATRVRVSGVTEDYCGASRPGHFEGVTTVVAKLFGVVQPDVAYFGEKDYQQLITIRRMVEDLNMPVRIVGMPIKREADGLAMSSRNAHLSDEERSAAHGMYAGLMEMKHRFDDEIDDVNRLIQMGMAEMMKKMGLVDGFRIEYLEIADPVSLEKREMTAERGDRILAAIQLGRTRLIDNVAL